VLALAACSRVGRGVTVSWTPPARDVDGSPLRDLAGYFIYFGTDPKLYTRVVKIRGATIDHTVIDGLPPGTYYFSIVAYTESGVQSALSPTVMKTVP